MPAKTLYVREDDADLWAEAAREAKARRLSLSSLVAMALQQMIGKTKT